MDKLISLSEEIRKELDKDPLFQEYISLKNEVDNNKELKALKQKMVLAKKEGRNDNYQKYLNEYNNHPLVVNFLFLESEVADYLKQISDILNEK